MKCITRLFALFVLALAVSVTTVQAQAQTGTVQGTILDQQGAVLPGVTATLTGQRGAQSAVSDGHGEFRFVGVAPGTYVLKVDLSGFVAQERDDVIVGMGKTLVVDFTLKVGGMSETVDVRATASTVDVKSSATDTTISNDLLTADADLFLDLHGPAERRAGHQQQLGLRRPGELRQRAPARRRGHARPGGRLRLDVLQPEPD